MFLDKSLIPAEKMDDVRLTVLEHAVLEEMQNPQYRLYVRIHEAAHAIYVERAGATRLVFHGPVALYDAGKDEFTVGSAAVQPQWGEVSVEMEVSTIARWYVAGGVAQRSLIGYFPGFEVDSDGQDYGRFYERDVEAISGLDPRKYFRNLGRCEEGCGEGLAQSCVPKNAMAEGARIRGIAAKHVASILRDEPRSQTLIELLRRRNSRRFVMGPHHDWLWPSSQF